MNLHYASKQMKHCIACNSPKPQHRANDCSICQFKVIVTHSTPGCGRVEPNLHGSTISSTCVINWGLQTHIKPLYTICKKANCDSTNFSRRFFSFCQMKLDWQIQHQIYLIQNLANFSDQTGWDWLVVIYLIEPCLFIHLSLNWK